MNESFVDALRSWISESANLFAVLGLSGVGILSAARAIWRRGSEP